MREFNCRDTGKNCDWTAGAETDVEILKLVFKHGREKHDLHDFSEDARGSVLLHIRDTKMPTEAI
jgi:predicted small metal-binding protein